MLRSIFLIISAFLAIGNTPAHAEADGPDYYAVTGVALNDVLNIRSEPRASSTKIGSIPHDGDGIRNLGCKGQLSFAEWESATKAERLAAAKKRWCNIEYEGSVGWVAAHYLTEGTGPAVSGTVDEPGNFWVLLSIDGRPAFGSSDINFAPDGAVFGSTGCNSFQGSAKIEGTRIEFIGPFGTTMMACAPDRLADQEQKILAVLEGSAGILFNPLTDQMQIVPEGQNPTLLYQRKQ